MKILFLTVGDETVASSRARVYRYIPLLEKEGIKCKTLSFTSRSKCRRIIELKKDNPFQYAFEFLYKIYVISTLFILSRRFSMIFVQKVILPKAVLNALKAINNRIIFDFDDAIYLAKDITHLLKGARCVIVSNNELREFALQYNQKVKEMISPVNVRPETRDRRLETEIVRLGWVGSPETSGYLNSVLPVFKNLLRRFKNLNIVFMGTGNNERFRSLGIESVGWSMEGENEFLNRIDIGIMPLEDDRWSRSKAGYKLLLYMSRGISCVASPVGINREIIKDGVNGFLAGSEEEWEKKLGILINDNMLRQKMGQAGKGIARELYSYEKKTPQLIDIFKSIEK